MSYELTISGLTSEGNVEEKHATFRDRDITNFNQNNKDNEFKWINTRLLHVIGRLNNYQTKAVKNKKNSLLQQAVILINKVAQVVEDMTKKDNESFILDEPLLPKIHTLSSTTCVRPESRIEPIKSNVNIHKWNLTYNGDTCVIFQSATELFMGNGLIWYLSITHDLSSYEDLEKRLKSALLPYNYEATLYDEIRSHTQGECERVILYIAAMENLFNRLPISHQKSHVYSSSDVLPNIQTHLALQALQVFKLAELMHLCQSIEETQIRAQRFRRPPSNVRHLLEPDLAYHKPHTSSHVKDLKPFCDNVELASSV
ncbi:hypothetical protein FQA39_LY06497 [Lamprigera yunnana]|nr:hypothetical protein FQA39_LY06497 [Lamprigera yunnana]